MMYSYRFLSVRSTNGSSRSRISFFSNALNQMQQFFAEKAQNDKRLELRGY